MADVDKGLYAAPVGIEEAAIDEQAIEIEIEEIGNAKVKFE